MQISQLQNTNDHLLIMLDTNPCLENIILEIESLYPEHAIYPFSPLTNDPAKFSVIIVPIKYIQNKPSQNQLIEMIHIEGLARTRGIISSTQHQLHTLHDRFDFKVISLEDFFIEQVENELMEAGYQANVYYHSAFTTGANPERLAQITQDLIYKPVTDTLSIRQWCLTDEKLLQTLSKKGVGLPNHFNEEFLVSLRENNQKIFGAEILVIAAKKV